MGGNNNKKIFVKMYVGFKAFHDGKFDRKQTFSTGPEN